MRKREREKLKKNEKGRMRQLRERERERVRKNDREKGVETNEKLRELNKNKKCRES
jgi:hypothetical protein